MWHAKPSGIYTRDSIQAHDNAKEIYKLLYSLGWTLEAVCGILGNIESESNYNPWRWQRDIILASDSPYIDIQSTHAYGLFQFDPAGKYIRNARGYAGYAPNFSDQAGRVSDGECQVRYINDHADYYPTQTYPMSYDAYKHATLETVPSVGYLARVWFANFERGTWDEGRATSAEYWFRELQNFDPRPTRPPIWLLFKMKEANNL